MNSKAIENYSEVINLNASGQVNSPATKALVDLALVERGLLYKLEGNCESATPDLEAYINSSNQHDKVFLAEAQQALQACQK